MFKTNGHNNVFPLTVHPCYRFCGERVDSESVPSAPVPAGGRFDWLEGAELLEAYLPQAGTIEIKLGTRVPCSNANTTFVAAARACRVVRTDNNGYTWIHEILGVTVSAASDGHAVVLRLGARKAVDVGRWDEDQALEMGGKKIPLPSRNCLLIASRGDETVATDSLPILPAWRVS